jgi:hypothetical protein
VAARIKGALNARVYVDACVKQRTTVEKTVDARKLAERRDSSRLNDNMERLVENSDIEYSNIFEYIKAAGTRHNENNNNSRIITITIE